MRRIHTTSATRRRPLVTLLATLAGLLACVVLAACSDASSDGSGGESAAGGSVTASDSGADSDAGQAMANALQSSPGARDAGRQPPLREPAIIATGSVALTAADVADARADAQRVAERHGGDVTDAQTSTDDDGDVRSTHLVLRVPSGAFAAVIGELEGIGTLVESSTTSEDVTQQVVDTDARVESQRASIDRLRLLLSRAEKLGDVISIESELSRREADLDSLLQQQAYLADQTSLSTITVTIERSGTGRSTSDDAGFLAGLGAGWDALTGFALGLATVAGALLPWTPVIALVGVPLWLLARRRRSAPETAGT